MDIILQIIIHFMNEYIFIPCMLGAHESIDSRDMLDLTSSVFQWDDESKYILSFIFQNVNLNIVNL